MDTVQTLTNVEVGRRIGLHHSSISRVRQGMRTPSLEAMAKIAEQFGWSLDRQAAAKARGRQAYSTEFETVIKAKFDHELALIDKPAAVSV